MTRNPTRGFDNVSTLNCVYHMSVPLAVLWTLYGILHYRLHLIFVLLDYIIAAIHATLTH